jgi:quinol-cytochrome oxidoreductase complex cytochrome b subunit
MQAIKTANLALRFLLELCALAALAYWGAEVGRGLLLKLVLGIGAPLVAAVVWGTFVAPKATVPVSTPIRILIEVVIFGLAAGGLVVAGRPALAWALLIVFVINDVLLYAWGQ